MVDSVTAQEPTSSSPPTSAVRDAANGAEFVDRVRKELNLDDPVITDVRRFAVLNLARIYGYQKNHANHVRHLAGRLFDQLVPLHGCSAADRELLDASALLHDLGTIIAYDGHHKHSQTLIHYNGLAVYSRLEICLIALLTRYHRKVTPDIEGHETVLDA